jgi:hypothetical protein
MNFQDRKKERIENYEKNVKGWKLRPCSACNGSGHYDHNGSPKCGACNGTGKEKYRPGLLEQIRDEQNKPKTEVNLADELSKPPKRPNTNVIYGGLKFMKKLQAINPKIFGGFKY